MKKLHSLHDLYVHELQDLYSAETQLLESLPEVAAKAHAPKVRRAFEEHTKVTQKQRDRLNKIFKNLGEEPGDETCKGMKGLLSEGRDILKASGDDASLDAALLAAGNKVEHYEIAGYGAARDHARILGFEDHATLLQQTLDEEGEADKKLTALAEELNMQSARSTE